jgi:DNA invertase Pin-like site-specific DNA recombinase
MATYGYVRVSSADQNEDRQLIALSEQQIPPAQIYTDKMSGKNFERPAYRALVKRLRHGAATYDVPKSFHQRRCRIR